MTVIMVSCPLDVHVGGTARIRGHQSWTKDPYLKLLDANGDGVLTAPEVYDFMFDLSNRIWQVGSGAVDHCCTDPDHKTMGEKSPVPIGKESTTAWRRIQPAMFDPEGSSACISWFWVGTIPITSHYKPLVTTIFWLAVLNMFSFSQYLGWLFG